MEGGLSTTRVTGGQFGPRVMVAFRYLALAGCGLTMALPLVWMLSTSLKAPDQIFVFPPRWMPESLSVANYAQAWNAVPFGRGFINSFVVSSAIAVGQLTTSSLAAFGFARMRFRFRDQLFMAYLATLMIPGVVTMIPVFILLRLLPEMMNAVFRTDVFAGTLTIAGVYGGTVMGVDSYFGLIAPGCFSAYGVFLLRQFFMTVPADLEDAAKIDGCSPMGVWRRIILPLSKPALATLVIFTFTGSWKSFMWPLIVTSSMEMRTLPVMLQSFQSQYYTEWTLLMAASVIALIPVIVVFLISQRYFVEGIHLGAIKG